MNTIEDTQVRLLNYLVKTYDSLTGVMTKTQQRMATLNPESVERYASGKMKFNTHTHLKDFTNHRNRVKTEIVRVLKNYSIYTEWLAHIKGIGPNIAANLILLYYYKFQPICKECGNELFFEKGKKKCDKCNAPLQKGLLHFTIKKKDFANISKWWSYMGQGVDENGRKAHRKEGEQCGYSTRGRQITWQISEQIVKRDGKYRDFYDYRKEKREKTHPDASKGHRHNMAKHEAAKIFLAHFWLVARTLDGKPLTKPYKEKWYLTKPFYFDMEKMIAITRESQL